MSNRRSSWMAKQVKPGDHIIYKVTMPPIVKQAWLDMQGDETSEIYEAPESIPFVARVAAVVESPGQPSRSSYEVVQLGIISGLPRSAVFRTRNLAAPESVVDWPKLSSVVFLLDRITGLSASMLRMHDATFKSSTSRSTTASGTASSSSRQSGSSSSSSLWVPDALRAFIKHYSGPSSLPLVTFSRSFLETALTHVLPSQSGPLSTLRTGAWLLLHSRSENSLYWGLVTHAGDSSLPSHQRILAVLRSKQKARLEEMPENRRRVPNLSTLLARRDWRHHFERHTRAVLAKAVRGVVDRRFIPQSIDDVPNESHLASELNFFDFVVAKSPSGQSQSYCTGWIIPDDHGSGIRLWIEDSKADYLSAVANMQRAIRVSRNDVLRVVHPASYMLRPLRTGTEVYVIVWNKGATIAKARIATTHQQEQSGLRPLWLSAQHLNCRVPVILRGSRQRRFIVEYERRNVFETRTHAELRLERFLRLRGVPNAGDMDARMHLRRRAPDYQAGSSVGSSSSNATRSTSVLS